MRLKLALLVALLPVLSLTPSFADSITFVAPGGANAGGVYTYPYNMSVDGGAQTAMACINYDLEITQGESWQIAILAIPLDNSTNSINQRADALLFSQFNLGTYSNTDLQFAIWDVLDPAVSSNTAFTSNAAALAQGALSYAQNASITSSGFYSQFDLYAPVTTNPTGWTQGQPQTFVGHTAVTPEPSSLALLGTGIITVGTLVRQRLKRGVSA